MAFHYQPSRHSLHYKAICNHYNQLSGRTMATIDEFNLCLRTTLYPLIDRICRHIDRAPDGLVIDNPQIFAELHQQLREYLGVEHAIEGVSDLRSQQDLDFLLAGIDAIINWLITFAEVVGVDSIGKALNDFITAYNRSNESSPDRSPDSSSHTSATQASATAQPPVPAPAAQQ